MDFSNKNRMFNHCKYSFLRVTEVMEMHLALPVLKKKNATKNVEILSFLCYGHHVVGIKLYGTAPL